MDTSKDGSNKDLKKLFEDAAAIAGSVPESMHEVAFSRALDLLMGSSTSDVVKPSGPAERGKRVVNGESTDVDALLSHIDRTKYPQITASTTVLHRALWVLKIARDDFGLDGLTPPQISEVLSKKFRVATSANQVSDKLGKAGAEVDRDKVGKGYVYRLMSAGEAQLSGEPVTRAKTAKRRTRPAGSSEKAQAKSATTRSSSRPGPKAMVADLLSLSYFKDPKDIAAVIQRIQETKAYTYKATDIAPTLARFVRSGELTRTKNASGHYEYRSTK